MDESVSLFQDSERRAKRYDPDPPTTSPVTIMGPNIRKQYESQYVDCSVALGRLRFCVETYLTSQKKNYFAIRHFQKKNNLTIDPLSLGKYAPSPQVLTYRPQILRGVRI